MYNEINPDLNFKAVVGDGNPYLSTQDQTGIDAYNKQLINDLVTSIGENGPGAYQVNWQYAPQGNSYSSTFTYDFLVGPDAFDENGNFDPSAINFSNPGSGVRADLKHINDAFNRTLYNSGDISVDQLSGVVPLDGYTTPSTVTTHNGVTIHVATEGNYKDPGIIDNFESMTADIVGQFANACNVNGDRVGFSGVSALVDSTFHSALEYGMENNVSGLTIYSFEPSNYKAVTLTPEEIDYIKNNDVAIFDIHCADMTFNKYGNNEGIHYYEIEVTATDEHGNPDTGHMYVHQLFSSYEFQNITSGDFDWNNLPTEYYVQGDGNVSEGLKHFEYKVIEHNADGTISEKPLTLDDLNEIMARRRVVSNLDFVEQSLNSIIGIATGLKGKQTISPGSSTTKMPVDVIKYYNGITDGINVLCSKLDGEIKTIIETAQDYSRLDVQMGEEAELLAGEFAKSVESEKYNIPDLRSYTQVPDDVKNE